MLISINAISWWLRTWDFDQQRPTFPRYVVSGELVDRSGSKGKRRRAEIQNRVTDLAQCHLGLRTHRICFLNQFVEVAVGPQVVLLSRVRALQFHPVLPCSLPFPALSFFCFVDIALYQIVPQLCDAGPPADPLRFTKRLNLTIPLRLQRFKNLSVVRDNIEFRVPTGKQSFSFLRSWGIHAVLRNPTRFKKLVVQKSELLER